MSNIKNKLTQENKLVKEIVDDLGWNNKQKWKNKVTKKIELSNNEKVMKKEVSEKSVLTPKKLHAVPPFDVSEKILKLQRKKEREKTKGKKWYGLPEMTEEIKRDRQIVQMRCVWDPKRFYKKNDLKVLPKYFQVGKIMDSPLDYYNNRLTKKEKKKSMVDQVLAEVYQ